MLLTLTFSTACAEREDTDKPWEGTAIGADDDDDDDDEVSGNVKIQSVSGDWGDIDVFFALTPADRASRSIMRLEMQGPCTGAEWAPAVFSGGGAGLVPGRHSVTWHSWDSEAGCAGTVSLRLVTNQDEVSAPYEFEIDNTRSGQDGFVDFPQFDQGLNDLEIPAFDWAVDVLTEDPSVDFVATRYGETYEVYAKRGYVIFQRVNTAHGYEYEVLEEDNNPIAVQEVDFAVELDDLLALGGNPNNANWPGEGYPDGDPRLSFPEPEDDSYPFGYHRIAAYFDHPDSADIMINWKGYAHSVSYVGNHGSLNVIQSRSPLLMWGKGVKPGVVDEPVQQVDVAPTVAKLMGMQPTFGIDERGIWSNNVLLRWQDGHVIDAALDGRTPAHTIVIIMDGLTHTEILDKYENQPELVPNFSRFFDEGAYAKYGSISNWPSVTYPGHNVVGSGMFSGHHGIVDNKYYIRDDAYRANPIDTLLLSESLFNTYWPGETLHIAAHRNFGDWDPSSGQGVFTAALFDPSTLGADKASLEFRDHSGYVPFGGLGAEWPLEVPGADPELIHTSSQVMEILSKLAMNELYNLFDNPLVPRPAYTIMNWITTDDSGHKNGPHGPEMTKVIAHNDELLGILFDWLEQWGIEDETAIFITSDHGMQLGDPTRGGWPPDSLDAAGIKRSADTYLGVYLAVPVATFEPETVQAGVETTYTVAVTDENRGLPIAGATLTIDVDGDETVVITGEDGMAEFTATAAGEIDVHVEQADFTPSDYTIPTAK
ncbi:MAG: alkaline phosphatase family protein [Deltaproteobacteria bacterium]|nr:alkaline phosphatase family protein [Deltaproteobacteria bacterium]